MEITQDMTISEKLKILTDAAKYDVACTSSGVDRGNKGQGIGDTHACGICHTFSADGRCVSLLKILFTNECIFDCKYCINRKSNDVPRASFTPDEVCRLTIEFYRRNYIEGLFLSSGIFKESSIIQWDLFTKLFGSCVMNISFLDIFTLKAIPGASEDIIEKVGFVADRMSVNLELPTKEGLQQLAPNKNYTNILKPMKQIQMGSGRLISDGKEGYQIVTRTGRKNNSKFVPAGQRHTG